MMIKSYHDAVVYIKEHGMRNFLSGFNQTTHSKVNPSVPVLMNKRVKNMKANGNNGVVKNNFDHSQQIPVPKEDMGKVYATTSPSSINDLVLDIKDVDWETKVPKEYNGYYFPYCTNNIITRLKIGRNIFISGPVGCGKSEMVTKLADLYKQKVIRVNLSVGTTEGHLIGKFIANSGSTKFIYGIVPLCMKNGWWLLLDEIDYAQPEHLAILQPILEGDNLLISQNENEEIIPHPNFRVFATANTKGRGDETQSYVGTNFLNIAFLDRWSIFELTYTDFESKIIDKMMPDKTLANQLNTFFGIVRKAISEGELANIQFSTRRLIHVLEMLSVGESFRDVMEYEIFSRYDSHEVEIIKEFAYDIWDRDYYFNKSWNIGQEHYIKPETEVATF